MTTAHVTPPASIWTDDASPEVLLLARLCLLLYRNLRYVFIRNVRSKANDTEQGQRHPAILLASSYCWPVLYAGFHFAPEKPSPVIVIRAPPSKPTA